MWPANTPALWSLISLVSDVSSSLARMSDSLSVPLKPGAKAAPYCLRKVPTSVLPCFRLILTILVAMAVVEAWLFHRFPPAVQSAYYLSRFAKMGCLIDDISKRR